MSPSTAFRLVPWVVVAALVVYVMFLRRETADSDADFLRTQDSLRTEQARYSRMADDSLAFAKKIHELRDSVRLRRPPIFVLNDRNARLLDGLDLDSVYVLSMQGPSRFDSASTRVVPDLR